MLKHSLAVACILVVHLSAVSSWSFSAPESPERLILILDASGSMWGQIDGENKIVIARRVLKVLLSKLDEQANVGLVAYGHRREKDCEDIELVTPLSPLDRAAFAKQIDAINPRGKTPITQAIGKALDAVSPDQGATTIVLFSDGLETCGGDPCQAVTQAKADGIDFVMHIIGFDVSKEDVSQLECAAQAGGGLYLSAENAAELASAFERAVAPVAVSDAFLSVKAVANGELIDARVSVTRSGSDEEIAAGRTYTASATNPRLLPLTAGDYDVEVQAVRFKGEITQAFAGVTVASGDTLSKVVDFSVGELAVQVTRNGKLSDATINVYNAGTNSRVAAGRSYNSARSNPKVFELTPGSYDVVIGSVEMQGKPETRLAGVVVTPGDRTQHTHNFESGTLRIGAVQDVELVDAVVKVTDAVSGAVVAQGRTYTSTNSNPKAFEVGPGRYRVTAQAVKLDGSPEKSLQVEVTAVRVTEHIVDFAK